MSCPRNTQSQSQSLHGIFLGLAAVICLGLSGCSALNLATPKLSTPIAAAAVGDMGTYTVEMHSTFGGTSGHKGQLDGNTTVSQALMASNAYKKYRSMEVEVRRVVEKGGAARGLVMPVRYDAGTRSVPPEQDYALIDGDRIVVKPGSGSSVLGLLTTLIGGGG